jgi:hypothetical protein
LLRDEITGGRVELIEAYLLCCPYSPTAGKPILRCSAAIAGPEPAQKDVFLTLLGRSVEAPTAASIAMRQNLAIGVGEYNVQKNGGAGGQQ